MGALAAAGCTMGCTWRPWLHATHCAQQAQHVQWGLSQRACRRAHRLGPFSTAGARRLQAFVHYRSSHNRV